MRSILFVLPALMLICGNPAQAAVSISVDKNTQQMTVSVDGSPRYTWPVSSGNPSHETPNGSFRTFRMEEDHYSKEFDDAPMPNAIFFTKQGHAIHGTDSVNRLGSPASHGCVRLSRANAKTLWDLVKAEGVQNTTVTLTGSSQIALARNPRPRTNTASASARETASQYAAPQNTTPQYDAYGRPLQILPQQRAAAQPDADLQYGEDVYGNSRARTPSPDRDYSQQTYQQQRLYYGGTEWPAQRQQRRIYVDPRTGQRYYAQDSYAADDSYARPRYYYGARGGY